MLWAGTDDGYLWVTRDGGAKWTNVTDNLKKAGLPGFRWVSSIEPGRKVEGRCYVCLDAHRSDDDKPYICSPRTTTAKRGRRITNNLPEFGSTRVLREDITSPDILYCGTEFAIWVSINRGETWARLNNNLPTVAVHEVAQPDHRQRNRHRHARPQRVGSGRGEYPPDEAHDAEGRRDAVRPGDDYAVALRPRQLPLLARRAEVLRHESRPRGRDRLHARRRTRRKCR